MPRSVKNKLKEEPYIKPNYHEQKTKYDNDNEIILKNKLRCFDDIYKRLKWDKKLNISLDNVYITYFDKKLDKLMNIKYNDWIYIKNGGDIPQYLIKYIYIKINKNNNIKIWDKKTKIDRLYGSGNTKDYQLINNISFFKKSKQKNHENKIIKTMNNPIESIKFCDNLNKYFPRYPTTNDGFVKSYNLDNINMWLPQLKKYGFVVLKNVINAHECLKTIKSMFDEIYEYSIECSKKNNDNRKITKLDMINPSTWHNNNFPNPKWKFLIDRPAFSFQAFKNRSNKNIYQLFKLVYNNEKLNVSIDNWGCHRGTKNLDFYNIDNNELMSSNVERNDWRKSLGPHWDIDPYYYNECLNNGKYVNIYQGCLSLVDHTIQDGCHLALPGCINFLKNWCESRPKKMKNKTLNRLNIDVNDIITKYMQPIPLRKGEMIIWDYGNLHGTLPNYSNKMRLVQYIRMYPSKKQYIDRDKFSSQNVLKRYKNIDIRRILNGKYTSYELKLFGYRNYTNI